MTFFKMNDTITKKNKLSALVKDALIGIQAEINKAHHGAETVDGLQQLQFIESQLKQIETSLNEKTWENIEKPGIARLVIDTWPINNSLGEKICQIEYDFGRLKISSNKMKHHDLILRI